MIHPYVTRVYRRFWDNLGHNLSMYRAGRISYFKRARLLSQVEWFVTKLIVCKIEKLNKQHTVSWMTIPLIAVFLIFFFSRSSPNNRRGRLKEQWSCFQELQGVITGRYNQISFHPHCTLNDQNKILWVPLKIACSEFLNFIRHQFLIARREKLN